MEKAKNNSRVMWIAETALIIALLIVIQLITFVIPKGMSQFITGSLVNLVLIVGSGTVGFAVAALAAVFSPLLAFVMGQMPFPQMILLIAIGNLAIVAVTYIFFQKKAEGKQRIINDAFGVIAGALVKWAILWGATIWIMVPIFFAGNAQVGAKLSLMFSWPQLVTALIGGFIALLVMPTVRKYRSSRK